MLHLSEDGANLDLNIREGPGSGVISLLGFLKGGLVEGGHDPRPYGSSMGKTYRTCQE